MLKKLIEIRNELMNKEYPPDKVPYVNIQVSALIEIIDFTLQFNGASSVIYTFKDFNLEGIKMPLITVYYNTFDFPGLFIARLFDMDRPTQFCIIKSTHNEIKESIPFMFHRLDRSLNDDPNIVEVYI